jgi:preprotein translocase subunit YajC
MIKLIAQAAATGASAPQAGAGPQFSVQLIVMGLIFAGFYVMFIAPQRKKQKEHDKMLASLQTGDEVVTSGGIFGTITNVRDDRFVVRVSDNTKIEVGKGFIQSVVKKPAEEKKSS